MSVDIIMYKIRTMTKDELLKIRHTNVNDLSETDGWKLKACSFEEMSKNPARFEQIKDFMRTVELMQTTIDYRACCVAHGMPDDVKSYSMCHHYGGGIDVSFDGGHFRLTATDLDEFTKTEKKTYCVFKCEYIDANVDNWVSRSLMNAFESELANGPNIDLSYTPIHLNAQTCDMLCKILVRLYDQDELYPNEELAKFMLELMRTMCHSDDVFIEFQD